MVGRRLWEILQMNKKNVWKDVKHVTKRQVKNKVMVEEVNGQEGGGLGIL